MYVDIGFGTILRQKLRLHGIDTPPAGTPQGDAAHAYVASLLQPGCAMVIRSYTSDAFGRYLADIFCPAQPSHATTPRTFNQILASGIFLNQDLLTRRLAVRVKL